MRVGDCLHRPALGPGGTTLDGGPDRGVVAVRGVEHHPDLVLRLVVLVVVVGGLGGVFRLLGGTWSKYGLNLPSALVTDVIYVPQFDRLVAGTYGRGAWTVDNVAASIGMRGCTSRDGPGLRGRRPTT